MDGMTAEKVAWIEQTLGVKVSLDAPATVATAPSAGHTPPVASGKEKPETPAASGRQAAPPHAPPANQAGAPPPADDKKAAYEALLATIEARAAPLAAGIGSVEIAAIRRECIDPAKALVASAAHDYAGAIALLNKAPKRLDEAELHRRRYETGLKGAQSDYAAMVHWANVAAGRWVGWGGAPIKGVTEVLAKVKTNGLDAGQAKAATGDYAGAMQALDTATVPIMDVSQKLRVFDQYAVNRGVAAMTWDGTAAGAPPAVTAALAAIKTETLDKADAAAHAGKYDEAVTAVQAAGPRLAPLSELATQRNALVSVIQGLAAPGVATDKAKLQHERLDAADAMLPSGDIKGATALLTKANEEAADIQHYATALAAAEQELAKLTDPALAADVANLRKTYVDPARKRADAWDYAGGAAQLAQLVTQAPAVGKLAQTRGAAEASSKQVNDKAAKNPASGLADAKKLLVDLEKDANSASIKTQLDTIRADVGAAEAAVGASKPDAAREALDKVGKELVAARMDADRNGQANTRMQAARALVAALPASVAAEKATIQTTMIDAAAAKFAANDRDAGLALLAQVDAACADATKLAAKSAQYDTLFPKAQAAVNKLTDPFIATDNTTIKTTMLDAAVAKATARDFQAALPLLGQVIPACNTALRIAGVNADYTTALTQLTGIRDQTKTNITYGQNHHMPIGADLTTALAEIDTKYITPATSKAGGRALGEPGLQAMNDALALVNQGLGKGFEVVNASFYYVGASTIAKAATDALTALKAHPQHAAVANDIKALDAQAAGAAKMLAAHQYAPAGKAYQAVTSGCTDATAIANAAAGYATALAAAQTRMAACKAIVAAQAPAPPATGLLADAEAQTIAAAQAKVATRDYAEATSLLATVDASCAKIEALAAQQKTFAEKLTAVEAVLAKLKSPIVAEDIKNLLTERVTPAKTAAAAANFKTALDLIAKAGTELAGIEKIQTGDEAAKSGRDAAQKAADGGNLPGAVAALQTQLDALVAHPQAASIKKLTDDIAANLVALRKQPPPADTKTLLANAAEHIVEARNAADRDAAYTAALTTAQTAIAALTSAAVAADKTKIQHDRIDAAKALADPAKRDYPGAMALLDKATDEIATARDIADKDAAYQTALTAAQAVLDALHAITPTLDAVIGADAQALQAGSIDRAKALVAAPARDYDGALKLLATVGPACKSLELKRKMGAATAAAPADPADTKARIAAIMAEPGGAAQLDKMVASLPDTLPPEVIKAAIEARFGVNSFNYLTKGGGVPNPDGTPAKSLKKIYTLMAKVPQGNVKDNASLKDIDLFGDADNAPAASFYSPSDKKIVLACGRADDNDPQPLENAPQALPNVDKDSEMVPDSEVPTPKYFDWTTLHEVGHAIDDKTQFMNHRQGDSAFGGWQTHGADVLPVARAVAKACKLTGPAAETYLVAYLSGAKVPAPPAPPARPDWADALKNGREWCDAIRVDKNLWETSGGASSHAVDGRVYHEAYGGTWVSYELAARTKGITGYQFRAPGEWVAELYAAYHSKKLKPSNPAANWLATL